MVLGRRKTSVLQDTLKRLRDFVNGLGGVPDARTDLGIKNSAISGLDRNWTSAEAQQFLMLQKQYLEFCVGGRRLNRLLCLSLTINFVVWYEICRLKHFVVCVYFVMYFDGCD